MKRNSQGWLTRQVIEQVESVDRIFLLLLRSATLQLPLYLIFKFKYWRDVCLYWTVGKLFFSLAHSVASAFLSHIHINGCNASQHTKRYIKSISSEDCDSMMVGAKKWVKQPTTTTLHSFKWERLSFCMAFFFQFFISYNGRRKKYI